MTDAAEVKPAFTPAAGEGAAAEEPSFIAAAASVDVDDVENQPQQAGGAGGADSNNGAAAADKPAASATSNVGIFAEEEDDTASVFSFDSYVNQPRIPLQAQSAMNEQRAKLMASGGDVEAGEGGAVPFPSVVGRSMEVERAVNVCPCRCLFFTLKETICLVMSALGCAVFLAGLVVLCMYLEGSLFNNSGSEE
ncbi:hypothetical protein ACHAXT_007275 [Thalassiosira profunda]